MTASNGGTAELTRFTTAAGYDKTQGTAPVLRSVHLWAGPLPGGGHRLGRLRFAEYHGFITVDYDPAVVPNTPPARLVQTIHLAPKNGGSEQAFMYVGETPFKGLEPTGDYPTPIGLWHPELDATRQICLSVSAFGDGDIARLPVTSETVCADVVQLSAAGAPPPPQIGGGGASGGSRNYHWRWGHHRRRRGQRRRRVRLRGRRHRQLPGIARAAGRRVALGLRPRRH